MQVLARPECRRLQGQDAGAHKARMTRGRCPGAESWCTRVAGQWESGAGHVYWKLPRREVEQTKQAA
eukprot:357517-Chlamydomonas_euryale.AAC.1